MSPTKKDETDDLLSDIESIASSSSASAFTTTTSHRKPRIFHLRFFNLLLAALWVLCFWHFHHASSHDPSSVFFRRDEAYRPAYSAAREKEADAYVAAVEEQWHLEPFVPHNKNRGPRYCVGIPSVQRQREQFLARTLASLVDSLRPQQRRALHVVVLLSDDDVKANSAYGQDWLHAMADTILVRQNASSSSSSSSSSSFPQGGHYRRIPRLPASTGRMRHTQLDQAALLKTCRERDAEYVMLIEDDVIASRDWFARVASALPRVEAAASKEDEGKDWLYLRLFYSETYLGWNAEEWPVYARYVALAYLVAGIVLLSLRRLYLHLSSIPQDRPHAFSRSSGRIVSPRTLLAHALLLLLWMSLFTGLYFMAGRLTVQPLSRGIHKMPRYGCCGQGLVFPRRHVAELEAVMAGDRYGLPADSSVDALAEELGLDTWAVVPCVLQHVGARGSSSAGGARKLTWNFSFERVYS